MRKFNTEQKVYDIGKVRVGGQPGELPTFLIGSIFWLGQKMVQDANKGVFDAKQAEQIINTMHTQSDMSGVPFGLDVVGTTEEAFGKYIDFVAKHTDAPIMLDAMSPWEWRRSPTEMASMGGSLLTGMTQAMVMILGLSRPPEVTSTTGPWLIMRPALFFGSSIFTVILP